MIFTSTYESVPNIPTHNSVITFLESPRLSDPSYQEKRIFVDAVTGEDYTVRQFRKLIPRAAAYLKNELGIQKNDIVGVFGINNIFTPIVHFAALSLGAIVSPANIMYSAEEYAHQLHLAKAKIIVVFDDAKSVAEQACVKAECPSRLITFSELFSKFRSFMTNESVPEVYPVDVDAGTHTAYLCFSSGTSGFPKAVVTTHYNIIGNILQQFAAEIPVVDPELAQSGLLPMSHIYGLNASIWLGAYAGKMTVVFPKFDLELLVRKTIEHKLGILFLVPPIILLLGKTDILLKYPEFSKYVKYIASGAAPISKETIQMVNRHMPDTLIVQVYGLTETSPFAISGLHSDPIVQAKYDQEGIGWLLPGVEARLVSPETGEDVTGYNQPGELWLRGPMVMAEYFKNPQATAETKTADHWFKTADVAKVSESNQFYIVDRIKELIKSNGHQVAPAELESILLTHPHVLDSAVIGILNEDKTSENPRAFIVLQEGAIVEEVVKWFNRRVAKHKRLWGGAVVIDAVPKSASGKILRKDLRNFKDYKVVGLELVHPAKL